MKRKIYVVDQNFMRRPKFVEFVNAHPSARFVIPDTGLVEMVKTEHWQDTFRNNFEAFVPIVTKCSMAMSIQEARELEIKTRASTIGRLLPSDFTKLLRGAIVESQTGIGPTMSLLRDGMATAREELLQHDLNIDANRGELERLVRKFLSELSTDGIKACRQDGIAGRIARLGIARAVGDGFYVAHMRKADVPDSVSRRLWKAKCMTRRWCYLQVHHALQWLGEGGIDNAKGQVVLNDILDQDYVLLGSAFDGILSFEADIHKALADLRMMLALPSSANAPFLDLSC